MGDGGIVGGASFFCVVIFFGFLIKKPYDVDNRAKRAFQVEQFRFVEISTFYSDAFDGRAYIIEVLLRKVLFSFLNAQEFPCLLLQFAQ